MDANSGEPWSEMDTGLPGPATQGFVSFLSHGNFFDERVDPSKRRCRDRRARGSAGTAKGSAPGTFQAG